MKRTLLGFAAAGLLGGCYYGPPGPGQGPGPGPGYAGGYAAPIGAEAYYDGYLGPAPIYDGYWGPGGVYVYRTGPNGPWVRDVDHHFRRDAGPGFRPVHVAHPGPHPEMDHGPDRH
jgi:hypothetical protein